MLHLNYINKLNKIYNTENINFLTTTDNVLNDYLFTVVFITTRGRR